jgi:hypothetical protein
VLKDVCAVVFGAKAEVALQMGMSCRTAIFLWALLPVIEGVLPGQESTHLPEFRTLYPAGRSNLHMPTFNYIGNARCDSSGNLFFDVSSIIQPSGPFLKVSSDGHHHTYLQLPPEAAKTGNIKWAVTPDGTLYVLHQDATKYTLLQPKVDGGLSDSMAIEVPESVDLQSFAVANSGYIFVSGANHIDSVHKKRPGYAAILNPSGKMIRDMSSDAAELGPLAEFQPINGDVIAGEDGRFYLLTAGKIRVITQSGETQNVFPLKMPDGFSPMRIDYSNGRISILLYEVAPAAAGHPLTFRAVLLNTQNGEVERSYRFADSVSGSVVCYNSREGYSLLTVDREGLAREIVPVR